MRRELQAPSLPDGFTYCAGNTMRVSVATGECDFNPGNTFRVEISDPTGNFAAPGWPKTTNALAGAGAGTYTFTLPNDLPFGTAYRIRVTGSNPAGVPVSPVNLPAGAGGNITIQPVPTGALAIVNSTCMNCALSGGSIAIGSVSIGGSSGTLQFSTNNGASWSSTLPTYNQSGPAQTILASVLGANGCRSGSVQVGQTTPGTCTPPNAGTISGPAIICPGGSALYTTNGDPGGAWSSSNNAIATVNNMGNVSATGIGAVTISYTVTTPGCASTTTRSVSVVDNTPPTITCPANTTVAANASCQGQVGSYAAATLSDNCNPSPTVTQSPAASTILTGHNTVQTVTLTANDGNGNTATCTLSVTLKDVTPPTITCPANTTVAANAGCQGQVGSYTAATLSDNCNPSPTVTQSPASSMILTGHNMTQTVTLTANDGNGNTATCTVNVTLKDVTPPSITCPANTTVAANASCQGQMGSYAAATLSDNCNPSPTVTQSPASSMILTGHNMTQTVTLTANDGNGNTATCTVNVTLKDVTPPTITCPANTTIAANVDCQGQIGNYNATTLSDNCNPAPTVTQSPASSTILTGHNATQTVTLTANDGNGNTATCTVNVTLKDVTPPSITCPANTTVAANAGCQGQVGSYTAATLSDNCNPAPIVTQSPASSTLLTGHNMMQTVTLTANDGNGNTATCTLTVTLKDVTPPSITCPANTTVATNASCQGQVGSYTAATLNDNCNPAPIVTQSPASSTVLTGHDAVQTVTLTANDGNGNTSTCSLTVTLKDVTPPSITCPANTTVAANASCQGQIGNYNATALSDHCNPSPTVTQSPASSTILTGHDAVQTVTLTADDGNGNTATCSLTVTLKDVTPPSITCPSPVTVSCASAVPAVNLASVTTSDNCGTPTKSYLGAVTSNQSCLNRRTVTRTYRAVDAVGNSATCVQIITVNDVTLPTFNTVPANMTVNCNAVPNPATNVTASDNCGGSVSVAYLGQTRTDGNCPDTYSLQRRWTATDLCGNVRTHTQTITVRDTQKPIFTSIPANVTVQCGAIPAVATPTAVDNCDASVTITYTGETRTNGACPDSYTLTRRWTAVDNCGNTRTASQRITVTDTQAPTFANVPANLTLQCSDPVPGAVNPTASDNCDASVTVQYLGQTTGGASCGNSYVLQRRWKATDNCGNYTITTQTITVQDTQAPVFTFVPADITIQCSTPLPFPGTATAVDNCQGYVQVVFQGEFHTDGDCLYDYTVTRTWRAVDQCGNSATATQVITVVDTQTPTFQNPPANVTVTCSNIPNPPVVVGQDNCGPAAVTYQGQSQSSGDCNSGYTITRTWTATDLCANVSTYTQTITVQGQNLEEPGGEERSMEENGGVRPPSTVHRLPFAVHRLPFAVALMPNPALDAVQVRFELDQSMEVTILLSDLSGRVVHTRTYLADAGENVYGLELETLAGGVYLVQVRAGEQRGVEKLVVLEK